MLLTLAPDGQAGDDTRPCRRDHGGIGCRSRRPRGLGLGGAWTSCRPCSERLAFAGPRQTIAQRAQPVPATESVLLEHGVGVDLHFLAVRAIELAILA